MHKRIIVNKNDECDDYEEFKEIEVMKDKWHLVSQDGPAYHSDSGKGKKIL